jgi:hypothetical protein
MLYAPREVFMKDKVIAGLVIVALSTFFAWLLIRVDNHISQIPTHRQLVERARGK